MIECIGDGPFTVFGQVLFGGVYSTRVENPVTKSRSCPPSYVSQILFGCNDNVICVSKETSNINAIRYALPFGGIFSSCNLAPLQTECDKGFDKFLINDLNGCQVYYCSKIKNFQQPDLKKLPFVEKPLRYNLIKALNLFRK